MGPHAEKRNGWKNRSQKVCGTKHIDFSSHERIEYPGQETQVTLASLLLHFTVLCCLSIDSYIVWMKSFFLCCFSMTTSNCFSLPWHSSQRAPFFLVDLTLAWLSLVSSWHLGLMMLLEALEMWGWAKPRRHSCLEWWDTIIHSFSSVLQARPQGGRVQPKFSWPKLLEMISAFLLNESPPEYLWIWGHFWWPWRS